MLVIENLCAVCEGIPILKGLNLKVGEGQIHAIMGPNGAGKSTLAKILAGHPSYEVIEGKIFFQGQDLLEKDPSERANLGLFLGFQYPPEVSGVTTKQFLFHSLNAKRKSLQKSPLSLDDFEELLMKKMDPLEMKKGFEERSINEGFSGGEKKRNEILQMVVLDPTLIVLDETDSGLDIDAMHIVAEGVNHFMNQEKGLILITHYQRLLEYIIPDFVHVLIDGKIALSGDKTLAYKLEQQGYEWVKNAV